MIRDDDYSTNGRVVTPRDPDTLPKDPRCPLHLQRVCGTCTHFDGHLRQEGLGHCRKFGRRVGPQRRAWTCAPWSRKARTEA